MFARAALGLVLALSAASVYAQEKMYKWTDAQGTVHYSTKPPDDQAAATELTLQKAPEPPASAATPADAQPQPPAVDASVACQRSKDNLRLLERDAALLVNKDGQQVLLTEQQRLEQIEANRAAIEQYCESDDASM